MPGRISKFMAAVALFGSTLLTLTVVADAALVKSGPASVEFTARATAGLKIEGKGQEVQVSEDGETLIVTVPLGQISTGIGLRDRHMKGTLAVDKYPNAELRVARNALKLPADGSSVKADVPGQMSLHGVSKPVTVNYEASRRGNSYVVRGMTHLEMTHFDIKPPSYMGISVKPGVDLIVSFGLVNQ